jgi:prevent-host-death family protein
MASPITHVRPPRRAKKSGTSSAKTSVPASSGPSGQAISTLTHWKLEDAKARFSEVVRLASTDGPQLVTVRGKEAAVILDPETYRRLLPVTEKELPLSEFLRGLSALGEIDIERERDTGREFEFEL